jgi:hypothetical protein
MVIDDLGATATSNEVSATIDDLFPAAVTLSAPDPVGQTTIGLSWTASADRDFQSYRLYRSDSAVGENDQLIVTISSQAHSSGSTRASRSDEVLPPGLRGRQRGHMTPSNG